MVDLEDETFKTGIVVRAGGVEVVEALLDGCVEERRGATRVSKRMSEARDDGGRNEQGITDIKGVMAVSVSW